MREESKVDFYSFEGEIGHADDFSIIKFQTLLVYTSYGTQPSISILSSNFDLHIIFQSDNLYRQVMNDLVKNKKTSNPHNKLTHIQQSHKQTTSSAKNLPSHCLPKSQPNIAQYQQYGQPRKLEQMKENQRTKQNNNYLQSTRQPAKSRNVLLQPRKSNQIQDPLRKTQKKMRKGVTQSEWVSPDEEGLGCHEHLSSQIFRQTGQSGINHRKTGQTGHRPLSIQQQLNEFQRRLTSLSWKEQQQALAESIRLEQEYSRQTKYGNYLQQQSQLNWKKRAVVLDWIMQLASQNNCRRQTYAASVSLLDRYLAVSPPLPIKKLQLTAAACLLIAQKLEDNSRISVNAIHLSISQGHELQELLETEIDITIKLKFRLKAPTVNSWANRLCAQWDLWIGLEGGGVAARFKIGDKDSYNNWRWISQYIDFALLDIKTLQYKNRTLAAAFLYLTLLLKQELYTAQEVSVNFRKQSHYILDSTPFNQLFSRFLMDSFGFPLQQILPAVQYCSNFAVLLLDFKQPQLLDEGIQLSFEQYCGIQTWNPNFKGSLEMLDRNFW